MALCAAMFSRGGFRLPSFSRVVRVHVLIEFLAGPYLHDQARGCSRYFPRPLFLYSMQSISMPCTPELHKRLACAAPCIKSALTSCLATYLSFGTFIWSGVSLARNTLGTLRLFDSRSKG